MSWTKKLIFSLTGIFLSLGLTLLILEVFLRLFPVYRPFDRVGGTDSQPTISFVEYQSTVFSQGIFFNFVVKKSTNNLGFVADNDYKKKSSPSLVIVGDSYVEAMQVLSSDSISGHMANLISPKEVYSFAMSGAALSQYLHWLDFSKREFSPKAYAFVIVGNDFDESLCMIRPHKGFHCFDDKLKLNLVPNDGDSAIRRIAKQSAILRYLVFHLRLNWRSLIGRLNILTSELSDNRIFAGNTESIKSEEVRQASLEAINAFLQGVKNLAGSAPVFFIVDADRTAIYNSDKGSESYFSEMRKSFMLRARALGFEVIDMKQVFVRDYSINQLRFEFPTDGHWNERAHLLAAEELFKAWSERSKLDKRIMK
jgi:hypothetical protein